MAWDIPAMPIHVFAVMRVNSDAVRINAIARNGMFVGTSREGGSDQRDQP
jgi:hypothetical protein